MPTPIPAFVSQIRSSGETIGVNSGSPAELSASRWYYFVSNRTTASNGQSLLKAIKDMLDAASSGLATTWTVTLALHAASGTYKINISHNHASTRTINFSASFAAALGFASANVTVLTATTAVADYPSVWWWTPNCPVHLTGPVGFDHSVEVGVPQSEGFAQRAPDGTTAYGQNGVLYDAWFQFNFVEPYYVVKPYTGYTNRDLRTWWLYGPAKGHRFLMWRDRSNCVGSNAPSEGSASPAYNYVEYAPSEVLRSTFPAKQPIEYDIHRWNVRLDCWLTSNGAAVLSD